jgi:60 kDa SS-A/Ro ribonucleoprotein
MAKLNKKAIGEPVSTHGGATAVRSSAQEELSRAVLACMLWEDQFYESGEAIADRIAKLIAKVDANTVLDLAKKARVEQHLRHAGLYLVAELERQFKEHTGKGRIAETLKTIVQRPDELTEYLALYWRDKTVNGKHTPPLTAQAKKGLAQAFEKFDAYQLAKYSNDDKTFKLKDVFRLVHPTTQDKGKWDTWVKLLNGALESPDTWEVALSGGADKKTTFERLIAEKKLGALALLRNLRNMQQSNVSDKLVREALSTANVEKVLPFRFITAAKYAPAFEPELEQLMFKCLDNMPRLKGKTIFIVDTSGSMYGGGVSGKSELTRVDVAASLAMLIREISEQPVIYATAGNDGTRIHATKQLAARRGFALRDLIANGELSREIGGGGIFLAQCMEYVFEKEHEADRIIVLTDEQDCDTKLNPATANAFGTKNYLINIASFQNGIGYGKWTHINGWSEAVVDYIIAAETQQ